MVNHPRSSPQPGRLRLAMVVDLPSTPRPLIAHQLSSLASARLRGHTVTVRVGRIHPPDVDSRAPSFLRDALRAGVDIVIDGDPSATDAWASAIRDDFESRLPAATSGTRRRLEAVRP